MSRKVCIEMVVQVTLVMEDQEVSEVIDETEIEFDVPEDVEVIDSAIVNYEILDSR